MWSKRTILLTVIIVVLAFISASTKQVYEEFYALRKFQRQVNRAIYGRCTHKQIHNCTTCADVVLAYKKANKTITKTSHIKKCNTCAKVINAHILHKLPYNPSQFSACSKRATNTSCKPFEDSKKCLTCDQVINARNEALYKYKNTKRKGWRPPFVDADPRLFEQCKQDKTDCKTNNNKKCYTCLEVIDEWKRSNKKWENELHNIRQCKV